MNRVPAKGVPAPRVPRTMTLSPTDAADQHGDLGPMHWDHGSPSDGPVPADASSLGRRRRWLGPTVLAFLAVLVVGVIGSSFITLTYFFFAPCSAPPGYSHGRSTEK